jgi:bifunctional non-homologous end joining protein LigD
MAAKADTLLKEYRKKRDFAKTAEPSGEKAKKGKESELIFIVQKHDATRLHYDFRLELDGVLLSWAVTKGPSLNPADKRLAVHVEDHPLDYAEFEGTIPKGEYGGGTVMLWDKGTWEPEGDPHAMLKKGDLKFTLHGKRLKGSWVIVHMKGRDTQRRSGTPRENWLLIKHRDDYAKTDIDVTEKFKTSVETGRDLEGIAKGLKSKKKTAKALEVPQANVWTRSGAVALPKFRPPQLATLVDEVPNGDNWVFELKYDGYRAVAALAGPEVRVYTRTGKDWTDTFHRLREPLSKITKGSALIDGEICAFNDAGKTDFGTLQEALGTGGPLAYFVFDLLEENGEDLTRLPLIERKERLRKLMAKAPKDIPVQFSDHIAGNGQKVFDAVSKAGQEGIIAKDGRSKYIGERSKTWLKIKATQRQEFVIGGWRPSDKHAGFASLLIGSWDGKTLVYHGRVGTGFTEASSAALQKKLDALARDTKPFDEVPRDIANRARWVEPKLVAEIAYTEMTGDEILRHPSFIGLREDKSSKSVKLEVAKSARKATR